MRKRERDDVKLRHLLVAAGRRFAAVRGPIWSSYETGSEIAQFVFQCKNDIEHGTLELFQKQELWGIFAPTRDWDDVVGDVELGNEIFALLEKLYGHEVKKA
jgi:hypothetical protein